MKPGARTKSDAIGCHCAVNELRTDCSFAEGISFRGANTVGLLCFAWEDSPGDPGLHPRPASHPLRLKMWKLKQFRLVVGEQEPMIPGIRWRGEWIPESPSVWTLQQDTQVLLFPCSLLCSECEKTLHMGMAVDWVIVFLGTEARTGTRRSLACECWSDPASAWREGELQGGRRLSRFKQRLPQRTKFGVRGSAGPRPLDPPPVERQAWLGAERCGRNRGVRHFITHTNHIITRG